MKVLHVINSLETGGAERLVSDLLPALARRGLDVEACVLAADAGPFGAKLLSEGIFVRTGRPGSLYSPARISDVARAIEASRPDLIHVHLAPALYWTVAALWRSGSRIPLVTTEHTTKTRRMSRAWLKPVERLLYRRVSRIVCVSHSSAAAVGAWLGSDPAELPVIANGVELEPFRGAKPARDVGTFLAGRRGVVMAARFTEAKDHATLIKAMVLLPEDYALVLAGEGVTRPAAEKLAADSGLDGRVLFAGARKDVPELLAACRVAVQSSHWEGFGLSAIEAMAAGLPVVASDVPGLADVVGEAGVLFAREDAQACARSILDVAEEGRKRTDAIAAGTRRSLGFSMDRCAGEYAALYADAIAAPGLNR